MLGRPHQQRPDIDNLTKSVLDALLPDDSRVWHLAHMTKIWGEAGTVIITLPDGGTA